MAKAKKTPSGSWRVLVFDHDEIITLPDGTIKKKKIRRSFTCSDPSPAGKREAERMAAEWAASKGLSSAAPPVTIGQIVRDYIDTKAGILSPTTIKGYKANLKNNFGAIKDFRLTSLKNADLQRWINGLASNHAPKSVKNIWGLFTAAVDAVGHSVRYNVSLPMQRPPALYTPSDDDVKAILAHISGTDLERAVLLAAFGTLRRSEICALTDDDIVGNRVIINKAAVPAEGRVVVKTPKTSSSYREVVLPEAVIEKLKGVKGRLVKIHPDALTRKFGAAVKACGLPHFRFHDLRAYSVSIAHAIGIPDAYLMQRGGWKSDRVLKQVYRRTIDQEQKRFDEQINDHFSQLVHSKVHST